MIFSSRALIAVALSSTAFFFASGVHAQSARSPEVRVFDIQKTGVSNQQNSFLGLDASVDVGGSVAVGDLNNDGKFEIVVGSGPGAAPTVRIFGRRGKLLAEFAPYANEMTFGVEVAVGDLNNDGSAEIVTGTGKGAGPQVRVFDMSGAPQFTNGFFAFDQEFRGGVTVAVGNIDETPGKEIIAGAGPGGGPHVRVFRKNGDFTGVDFFPFAAGDHGGVNVAAGNLDEDPQDEIVMSMRSFGQPWVKVYNADESIIGNFLAYSDDFRGGLSVSVADIDRDSRAEIITSIENAGGPHVRLFEADGSILSNGFFAYESDFRGGVSVAAMNIDNDQKIEVITFPQKQVIQGRADLYQYIEVDLSEQKLYAYKNGILENQFLVSTGIARYATPPGLTHVSAKLPLHDYKWSYGENHPDNYDIPNVPYNLRFRPNYFIHNAFWHNNFGHPMSHGCVNVNLENSKWIYEWTPIGTPVWVHE